LPAVVRPFLGRLAAPILFSALCACSQSLFDENVDDDGPGGGDDSADDADDSADGADDLGDDGSDDGVEPGCPAPCQGDPVADFSLEQGGGNGRWFYLVDRGDANGAGFDQLTAGSYDGAQAWVVDDDTGPAIVSCAGETPPAVCDGAGESLVMVPTPEENRHPVLAFRAPSDGSYRLAGEFRLPQGFQEAQMREFLISRNARHDVLLRSVFLSSSDPATLTVDVEALAGDLVQLTLLPGGEDNAPMAFDFAVTLLGGEGEIFPGRCMFAATFDDTPFEDKCRGATLENLNDELGKGTGVTVEGPSVNELHGLGRVFEEGQYIRSVGAPMDYRGDFTVQYWSRLDDPQTFSSVPFADRHGALGISGGVLFAVDEIEPFIEACYIWDDGTNPPEPPGACISGETPRDGNWHFTRLSRDAEAGVISLCVDGVFQDSDTQPGAFDMTTDQAPHLGRNVDFSPAYYGGGLDDVRVFRRALPCSP
jgi:hypothetical protein